MGVYETLFRFAEATSKYMGDAGTHPWAQGFPVTTQLPGGPVLPESVTLQASDLKYPKATGEPELREAIAAVSKYLRSSERAHKKSGSDRSFMRPVG